MSEPEDGTCGKCEFYEAREDDEDGFGQHGCPWPRSPEKKWCPPYRKLMKVRKELAPAKTFRDAVIASRVADMIEPEDPCNGDVRSEACEVFDGKKIIKAVQNVGGCPLYRELVKRTHELINARKYFIETLQRSEVEKRGIRAIDAGLKLAGEMMEATDGWLVCLRDFGDLHLDCKRAEEGWDGAKAENERLRAWAAGQPCERPIKTDHLGIDPDTGSVAGWVEKRCGKCVPCQCKAARERGE